MDFMRLAGKLGLEKDEYIELLELFIETSSADIINLENAVKTRNEDETKKASHSLKGSSASLGLTDIAEIVKLIEKSAKKNSIQDGMQLIATIKKKIDNIKHLING
jgi:HPt (histidine-containing phosphotransfer) domain-containing protein